MKTIITKVENNRIVKFTPVNDDVADETLNLLLNDYPNAFIYDGEYKPDLWIEGKVVSIKPLQIYVPKQVTMAQARLALYDEGLLGLVDETINLMPIQEQREKAKIQWEFETTVNRNSALVYGLAGGLGLTDEMLDNLFIKASKI